MRKAKSEKMVEKVVEAGIGLAIMSVLMPVMVEYLRMPWYKRLYFDLKSWIREHLRP